MFLKSQPGRLNRTTKREAIRKVAQSDPDPDRRAGGVTR